MNVFPGFKLSDSVEDFRKKWHSFIMKKHMEGGNIFGIHLSDATAVKDLDDKRKAMENRLKSFERKKEESTIRIPCVNPVMHDEAEETKCVANSKEKDPILSVSKTQSKNTCLCEQSPNETTLNVHAERTRNQFEEIIDESEQNCEGVEILNFTQEETSEKELCECIKELPSGVVKDILRKLRQNKTKEMKLLVALVQEEMRKKKSTSNKFKKKRKKQDSQKDSLERKSDDNAKETRNEYDFGVPLKCTETNCAALKEDVSYSADDILNAFIQEDRFAFRKYEIDYSVPPVFYDSDESDGLTWEIEENNCSYVWPTIFEDNLNLLNIYEEIINELIMSFGLDDNEVEDAIEVMNFNYRHVYKGQTPSVIDFNDKRNCVGYLHRFAPCHAALVKNEVASVLNSCPEISSKLESKHELGIVCLGGGPGNDLVGLLGAFTGMYWKDCDRWDFTVVDQMGGWAEVFPITVKKFVRDKFEFKFLMEYEMLEISASFIVADLTNIRTWSREMKEKLRKADVMTTVKVLSNIPETHRLPVLENVVLHMKPGAILFFIDCPPPPQELFFRNPSLKIRHKTEVEEFDFIHKKFKFGCSNITTCRAATYVIEMPNANKTEHVPDLDDVIEWPTLA
ncbi:hypothetical protein JTE90_006154 [Oedothorax gibbosus]|uniref:Uncharacterized protein n=1 Tax=Oedothorax gibbosus TaxID=931172 RepID=A0AAV6U586_9ARAC|nr:hypothetical protein JTE90_006154 [Oedothorax gibbosus]